jgi:hypothetical protein
MHAWMGGPDWLILIFSTGGWIQGFTRGTLCALPWTIPLPLGHLYFWVHVLLNYDLLKDRKLHLLIFFIERYDCTSLVWCFCTCIYCIRISSEYLGCPSSEAFIISLLWLHSKSFLLAIWVLGCTVINYNHSLCNRIPDLLLLSGYDIVPVKPSSPHSFSSLAFGDHYSLGLYELSFLRILHMSEILFLSFHTW